MRYHLVVVDVAGKPIPGSPPNSLERRDLMSPKCTTILLVDDEDAIRLVLHDHLNDLKYNVLLARNGDEAIAVIDSMIKIDLVITDIVMPGATDGLGLIEYVRRASPKTKTIAMSGFVGTYSANIQIVDKFMSKPFTFLALQREINLLVN